MMALHVCVYSTSCFFCCVFALSFLVTTLVCLPDPYPNQIESLLAFKTEFDLLCNNSVTNSWTNDAISFDGVSFDEETGAVTELKLRGACLYGTLDANSSLFSLNQLRYLDLSYNNLFSSFPAEFGRLTNLEFLDLHENGFTGEVSSSISNLSRLTYLDLKHNNFTSSFPHVYNLTKLSFLDLSDNRFEGKVPEWLWNLPSLIVMSLSYNSLDSFEGSPEAVDFSENRLGGQIPESIGLLKSLIVLNLSNNDFTGHIPSSLAKLTDLESLDLSRNQFSGNIPQELGVLSFLAYINMSHNKLMGEIPQGTQFAGQFESSFEGNINLCGPPLQKSCSERNGAPSAQTQQIKTPKQEHELNSKAPTIGDGPTLILMIFILGIGHVVIASYSFFAF